MKYKINFELPDETPDSFVVEGENEEQIRERAIAELEKRGGQFPWSEKLES